MSNFDLEKAKKTMTAQTCSGEPVEIITTEGRGDCPIIGYIGNEVEIETWRENGKHLVISGNSFEDLINIPIKREGWVNMYGGGNGDYRALGHYDSYESAKTCASSKVNDLPYAFTAFMQWEE